MAGDIVVSYLFQARRAPREGQEDPGARRRPKDHDKI